MVTPPGRAAVLLHLRLEEVATPLHELVARLLLEGPERGVVGVVVLLDDLEGPPALEDVATDQLVLQPVGQVVMARLPEPGDGLAEGEVSGAGEAVEGVEVAAGSLDRFECLGELADRRDGLVTDARGARVLRRQEGSPTMSTIQLTPNRSSSIPKMSPHICFSSGIVT